MNNKKILPILFFTTLIVTNYSFAIDNAELIKKNDIEAPLIMMDSEDGQKYKSVGRLIAGVSCTATLVSNVSHPDENQPALIIAAGHCVNDNMNNNEVIVNSDVSERKTWHFTPDYYIDNPNIQQVKINRVLYATMKIEDVAILELDKTYGEMKKDGYTPFVLSSENATQSKIELIHAPLVGIPSGKDFLRKSICENYNNHSVYENTYPWLWEKVIDNDCEGIYGGSSGSPVFKTGGKQIIGILSTTTEKYLVGCGLGRPCVIVDGKGQPMENRSYSISTNNIIRAFSSNGHFDTSALDDNRGDTLSRNAPFPTQSTIDGKPAKWHVEIDKDKVNNIRYAVIPYSSESCKDLTEEKYSPVLSAEAQPLRDLTLPSGKEGIHKVCVLNQYKDGTWTTLKNASFILREVDDTKPALPPRLAATESPTGWSVVISDQLYATNGVKTKLGPKDTTDCNDLKGYGFARNLFLSREKAPWRVCYYGVDAADNLGDVVYSDFMDQSH